ncbi:Holliday junction resolvase RuvX [soil metagenome]
MTAPGPSLTLLGFDVGEQRTGIAVGNTLSRTAEPIEVAQAERIWEAVERLVALWQPDGFVVGLPTQADGSDTHGTAAARKFANRLRGRLGKPVMLVDERYSTVEAESRYGRIAADHHAAAVLLQQYLDSSSPATDFPKPPTPPPPR